MFACKADKARNCSTLSSQDGSPSKSYLG
jgi:hypothetical protein